MNALRHRLPIAFCLVVSLFTASCSRGVEAQKQRAIQKGVQYYRGGKFAEASIQYRKALQVAPQSGEAYLGLGRSEEQQNSLRPAFDAFSKAAALMPDSDEAKIRLADVALKLYLGDPRRPEGLYRQVADLSDRLLAKKEDSFAAFRLKGYLASSRGKQQDTIAYFQRAETLRPDQADVVAMLVQALILNKQFEAGEARALSFLEKYPGYDPLYDILYSHYMNSGLTAKAEKLLQDKVARNPRQGLFYTQLAEHYWRTNRHREAAGWIAVLTGQSKEMPDAYRLAGDFYVRVRSWDDALEQYQAGMRANPGESVDYQEHICQVLLAQGKRDEAEKLLDELVRNHPENRRALAARAALFASSGRSEDLDQAIAGFKRLLGEDPSNLEYRLALAAAYRARGDLASASTQYLAAVQKNDTLIPALQALAEIMIRGQRFPEALRYAERVLALDPGNPSARLVLTACLAANKNYTEAETTLLGLIRDYPQLEEARLQMGLLRIAQKKYKDAEDVLLKFYRPGEEDVRILKGLIDVYQAENRPDKALALVQEAQRKSPQSREVQRLLASVAAGAGKLDLAII